MKDISMHILKRGYQKGSIEMVIKPTLPFTAKETILHLLVSDF